MATLKLYKVKVTKVVTEYALARSEGGARRALMEADLYESFQDVIGVVSSVEEVTSKGQLCNADDAVFPWDQPGVVVPSAGAVPEEDIGTTIVDDDDVFTVLEKLQMAKKTSKKKAKG